MDDCRTLPTSSERKYGEDRRQQNALGGVRPGADRSAYDYGGDRAFTRNAASRGRRNSSKLPRENDATLSRKLEEMNSVARQNKNVTGRKMTLAGVLAFACVTACATAAFCNSADADRPQSTSSLSQAQITAAFVFNFAKFTDWPQQAFVDSATPLTVCFLGGEDVRAAFQNISAGKTVNGRQILVRDVKFAGEVLDCRVVYVDGTNGPVVTGVLKNARQGCALVIGTSADFLVHGGIIKLLMENNRMRFDVNIGAAARAKIHLSSKLLALARSVVDLPEPAGN